MARKVQITKIGASTIVKTYELGKEDTTTVLRVFNGNYNIQVHNQNIIVGEDSTMIFNINELEVPFIGTQEAYLIEMATNLFFTDSKV